MAGQLDLQVSALSYLVSIGQSKFQPLGRAVGVGTAGVVAATPLPSALCTFTLLCALSTPLRVHMHCSKAHRHTN